jgi:hypothetical protein
MATQLAKWLAFYSPLLRGRFDFFLSASGPRREAWHQGLGLTGGRFWVRVVGGHDLRRVAGPAPAWSLSPSDVLVGRSDGASASVTTFPWVGHAAGAEYVYGLPVVGAGGVADTIGAPLVRAVFDQGGALVGPAPNAIRDLAVDPLSGGRFTLRWTYDETDEETAPAEFQVYNDVGSFGSVNFDAVVATVTYQLRRGYFGWTSAAFADGSRVTWAVRAASASEPEGPASPPVLGVAVAALPAAPEDVRIMAAED